MILILDYKEVGLQWIEIQTHIEGWLDNVVLNNTKSRKFEGFIGFDNYLDNFPKCHYLLRFYLFIYFQNSILVCYFCQMSKIVFLAICNRTHNITHQPLIMKQDEAGIRWKLEDAQLFINLVYIWSTKEHPISMTMTSLTSTQSIWLFN